MKRLTAVFSTLGFLLASGTAFAQATGGQRNININPGNIGISRDTTLGTVFSNGFKIAALLAAVVVLFMLVWGAFQWITSGGDKEAVGKARGRIIAALVGLVILALSLLIVVVVGQILHIDILNLGVLPSLDSR